MNDETKDSELKDEEVLSTEHEENPEAHTPNSEEPISDEDILSKTQSELAEMKDKYLRLYSEFENFRRRTSKEKIELTATASKEVIKELLTVLDDMDRAEKSWTETADMEAVKEGVNLVFQKFRRIMEAQGLKPMSAKGESFDVELHEAITQIPAPSEELKGKIVDEIEKGYLLNQKLIRFAKVVVGQ